MTAIASMVCLSPLLPINLSRQQDAAVLSAIQFFPMIKKYPNCPLNHSQITGTKFSSVYSAHYRQSSLLDIPLL